MKAKQLFINKKGNVFVPSSSKVKIHDRNQTYVIIRKGDELLCVYDGASELYTLPKFEDVENLASTADSSFKVLCYIKEKNRYYKEAQTFNVYNLTDGKISGDILEWCKINDILVHGLDFDETVYKGFKNLYVRDR